MYEYLLRRLLYPLYEGRIRGRRTFEYLAEYSRNQWLPPDQIAAIQRRKLRALIAHAGMHVPFYRRRWREAGIDWRSLRLPDDFERLPIVTKADIRAHRDEFVATPWRGHTLTKTTGGSTGEPLSFEYTRESYERRIAVRMRGYDWAGARIGRRTVMLWGVPLGRPPVVKRIKTGLHDVASRYKVLNSFELDRHTRDGFLDQMAAFRPEILICYVAPIVTLAEHALSSDRDVWSPEAILTGAEPLHEFQRRRIEEAFECPVFNTYGCREFMLIASECAEHRRLHINADHLAVEAVDDHGWSLPSGQSGHLLVTDLHNYGMPFIRYQLGDRGSLGAPGARCPCGRGLPLLASVDGRTLDMIHTADGRSIPGEFFPHLLKDVPGLERFQVVQHRLDHIEVLMVKAPGVDALPLDHAERAIRETVGPRVTIDYQVVDEIPLTYTGKRRVTLSKLAG